MQVSIFNSENTYTSKWYNFKNTELGKIYSIIPWEDLEKCLPVKTSNKGAPSWFTNAGLFGVMFLKHYLGLSDEKLIDRINTDWALQLFCGILLEDNERINDNSIVSRIRSWISEKGDLRTIQEVLIKGWQQDIEHSHLLLIDATCFESYIRFPTDVKILWESCEWIYEKQIFPLSKKVGIKRPRSKYKDQKIRQISYNKTRKKTYKNTRKRIRALLKLLNKGLGQLQQILNTHPGAGQDKSFYARLKTIKEVYAQQYYIFTHPGQSVPDRIVSLHKPYVRPIKRGKETKPTEFGAKVHMMQVGGIDLIEHISFDNFNEGTRLRSSILKHKKLFKVCHQLGADRIYATNNNRKFTTKQRITTGFVLKGRQSNDKAEKKAKQLINLERGTRLEGSFGNQKNNYSLRKVKALTQKNELVWIFFGIFTPNAVKIAKSRHPKEDQKNAA